MTVLASKQQADTWNFWHGLGLGIGIGIILALLIIFLLQVPPHQGGGTGILTGIGPITLANSGTSNPYPLPTY